MEKETKKFALCSTPIILLLSFPLFCVGLDFFWCNTIPLHQWMQYFSSPETSFNGGNPINRTLEEYKFIDSHLSRLVRGEVRKSLDATGFACDKTYHSFHCVSRKPVVIDTANMTVHIRSDHNSSQETIVRPYARQEDELKAISPVHIIRHTSTPPCHYHHGVPAVVFSSGSTGNVFHEMNEMIIPLFITTKHFQTRVLLIMEDYKPSFMTKYGSVVSRLSAYPVMNPAENSSTHCFPGSVIGLKYHDNLAVNSSDIPGGYGMPEFQAFLRLSFGLKFADVSQIKIRKPRLILLSRTNTRRFLNEEEMIETMRAMGFQVIVIKRSRVVSNLRKFSRLINSCSVLVGAHGAGLTNEIFLPRGAVMIQVELIGTEWASNAYYGDTAAAMGVRYLKYKIEAEESSLVKLYGRNHPYITDPVGLFMSSGYRAARSVYLDTQNVRVNISRFRETLVEAYSIVTDWAAR